LSELRKAVKERHDAAEGDDRIAWGRLQTVSRRIYKSLRGKPAVLLTPATVAQLGHAIQNALGKVTQEGEVTAAQIFKLTDPVIDAYRGIVWELPSKDEATETLEKLSEDVQTLLATSSSTVDEMSAEVAALRQQVSGVEDTAAAVKERVEKQVTRVDAAVTKASDATSTVAAELRERGTTVHEELREKAQTAEAKRVEEWKAGVEAWRGEFVDLIETQRQAGLEVDQALREHQAEAERIVGLIAGSGLAGHYKNLADRSRTAGYLYTALAVMLFCVPLIVGIITFNTLPPIDPQSGNWWASVLVRLAIGLAALVPAGYLAREATRFKRREDAARQRELEFSTLTNFIDALDEDTQAEVRKRLVDTYFGQPLVPPIASAKLESSDVLAKLIGRDSSEAHIKACTELVKMIAK
jgi:outer membrane murein-binding lipoprotein Lpp